MQYTKIQIGIAVSVARYENRMYELKDKGVSFDETFEEFMKNVSLEDDDTCVPKLIITLLTLVWQYMLNRYNCWYC